MEGGEERKLEGRGGYKEVWGGEEGMGRGDMGRGWMDGERENQSSHLSGCIGRPDGEVFVHCPLTCCQVVPHVSGTTPPVHAAQSDKPCVKGCGPPCPCNSQITQMSTSSTHIHVHHIHVHHIHVHHIHVHHIHVHHIHVHHIHVHHIHVHHIHVHTHVT